MSMLDTFFFNKGFNASKCKTLLKLTIPRIKLLRNRREIQLKQMRRDIAKLLETGQGATARIRVEHIVREENMMAAQEILELFCELISVRLPIIETQRECPLDLKEAISSVCFAAPRCSDLPELQQVQMLFASKYGREFVAAATELMPDCGVNRQIIELLSVRAPSAEVKLKLLKEIAEEHKLEWDPAASESELSKPHADLLNGPNQFISTPKLSLPEVRHDESLSPTNVKTCDEQSDSDARFASLDLLEVPKASLRPDSSNASSPGMVPRSPANPDLEPDDEIVESAQTMEDSSFEHCSEPDGILLGPCIASPNASFNASVGTILEKQFLPFVSPPSPSTSFSMRQSGTSHTLSRTTSNSNADFQNVFTAQASASASFSVKQSEPIPSPSRTKSNPNVDLQDVLDAALAAAESAAVAARSAASLAQDRISELIKNRDTSTLESGETPPHIEVSSVTEMPLRDSSQCFVDTVSVPNSVNSIPDHAPIQGSDSSSPISYDTAKTDTDGTGSKEQVSNYQPAHQFQRLTSLEDDIHFSYPNLFASKDMEVLNLGSDIHASADG
ncbi:hypothetical protein MRB53_015415 [Persea americana]|uniref:Uncharacterized protein n=1 Tax=Persea americana TaxID=3435 RepID=A0ACC2KE44_PERAE|nr:hypothetical protein MRB53_015415 [Persea americana]|eukprot:TRINITY_DN2065_c0_g2_i1.p1 TRINITY_DN2065_c0_g2~~TRINITY_DN2065_c0_g2_i1.p1  ORF type:complete len:561 (-),score=143.26 TRINITY_DN2065_c0_g2_i1:335-2017(-)